MENEEAIINPKHQQHCTSSGSTALNSLGMETVFGVDAADFCNTDDLVMLIDANNLNEQQWYENDLQLAAELGKTLLERNKELEFTLRQQQAVVEDQALEIEYLSKQTTALREVGESRSKVYEQLEISLQELEKSHQNLKQESLSDKKKIKSLSSCVSDLDQRCEQLQKTNEELRDVNQRERRISSERTKDPETSTEEQEESNDDDRLIDSLKKEMEELKRQLKRDQLFKDELDVEITSLIQENEQLRDQVVTFKQRENVRNSLPLDLKDVEDEFKLCYRCGSRDFRKSDRRLSDIISVMETELEDVEDDETGTGKYLVVKLNNGGTAYGNGESLVSAGKTVLEDETSNAYKWSLLTELDAQYRILIEKYERMVNARQQQLEEVPEKPEVEGACPSLDWHPTEESSSFSSGFSEGDDGLAHKSVQTDPPPGELPVDERVRTKQPFDNYFQRVPEYKTIFQEIFAVLKKSISYDEGSCADPYPMLSNSVSLGTLCETGHSFSGRKSYADVLMTGRRQRRQWMVKSSKQN